MRKEYIYGAVGFAIGYWVSGRLSDSDNRLSLFDRIFK